MDGLTVQSWRRFGNDRLYVNDASGRTVGYFDRKASKLHVDDPAMQYAVLEVLAPFLGNEAPALQHHAAMQPVVAGRDLAGNIAGAAVAQQAARLRPALVQRWVAKLLGQRTAATSWDVGAQGERIVGRRLERLREGGWQVLHSIPLVSGADIDHLLIGPGGIFTVNTKHHRGARVTVTRDWVRVNGHQYPYIRNSRHEAAGAARRLRGALGRPVEVRGVVVFVGAGSLKVRHAPADVLVTSDEAVASLMGSRPYALGPDVVRGVFQMARQSRMWSS
ncbi:nuclease-related domain-containing protein [Catenulispora rubra]|uniref:nuclease-related domain-containing protein n=1 Tax=Catenulispora rubra TaxID=280293 RepID=UPI00189256C9|nr:nuclease-related domain-containing protein [Catenulispora rubra]